MKKSLFSEFESASSKVWKQQIQVELKGADFNEKLISKTADGIDIKPFYHADDIEHFTPISVSKWYICQAFQINKNTNEQPILDAVNRGAEQIKLLVDTTSTPIKNLVAQLKQQHTPIVICFKKVDFSAFAEIYQQLSGQAVMEFDPIAQLGKTGNWYANQKTDIDFVKKIALQNDFTLNLQLEHYQQAGANHVQQLAYALAHVNEYLNKAENEDFLNQINALHLSVAVGSNYFFEIAKLRALRVLMHSLLCEYQLDFPITIFATPSIRNKTLFDYNVNMLRTTTECMSAVLGGANVVCNINYDAIYQNENEFANRISRNQLLLLKNESYFDKVQNPADGSYYIEKITSQFQDKALDIFKDIEQGGGLIKQLFEGKIQKKIKEQDAKERDSVIAGTQKLVGTNAYQNKEEQINLNFDKSPFLEFKAKKTLVEPILQKRLAEEIEKERISQFKKS